MPRSQKGCSHIPNPDRNGRGLLQQTEHSSHVPSNSPSGDRGPLVLGGVDWGKLLPLLYLSQGYIRTFISRPVKLAHSDSANIHISLYEYFTDLSKSCKPASCGGRGSTYRKSLIVALLYM